MLWWRRVFSLSGRQDVGVELFSFSKPFNMTGLADRVRCRQPG